MEWAFASGYQVVIATAPLFPLLAIQERLRWAEIDECPFTLITSMETSHFAKPHPEYLAEILARLELGRLGASTHEWFSTHFCFFYDYRSAHNSKCSLGKNSMGGCDRHSHFRSA